MAGNKRYSTSFWGLLAGFEQFIKRRFNFLEPIDSEDPELADFVEEKDGQVKVETDEQIVVEKRKEWMEIEHAQIEPDGE